ncbi:MAG: hypothetical protein ACPG43_04695 [Alcanivoracaceae bacterium]
MKGLVLAVVLVMSVAAAMVGVRVYLQAPEADSAAPVAAEPAMDKPADTATAPVSAPQVAPAEELAPEAEPPVASTPEPLQQWQPDPDAVQSLRRSMEEGDPRAPPIARQESEREMPTEEELADPDLYLQYETRQQQKVYASFVQASEKKISDLKKMIDRARAEGSVSPEQLAEGEEKLRRLEEMREKLLQENPELADPDAGQESDTGAQAE